MDLLIFRKKEKIVKEKLPRKGRLFCFNVSRHKFLRCKHRAIVELKVREKRSETYYSGFMTVSG